MDTVNMNWLGVCLIMQVKAALLCGICKKKTIAFTSKTFPESSANSHSDAKALHNDAEYICTLRGIDTGLFNDVTWMLNVLGVLENPTSNVAKNLLKMKIILQPLRKCTETLGMVIQCFVACQSWICPERRWDLEVSKEVPFHVS